MSALSRIEQRLTKWNKLSSLLHKPNEPLLLPIDRLNDLLKLCANSSYLRIGESIHAHLIITNQSSRPQDVFQINSLINLYGKCRETVRARKLFDTMPERNVVSWSAMMKGYQDTGFDSEVLKLFKKMVSSGQSMPNEYIATLVFKSCSSLKSIEEGKQCHGCFLKNGLLSHEFVRNTLVYMYSSCSDNGEEAIQVLDELPCTDLSVFSSALSGYLDNGSLKEGLDVLRKMAKEDFVWNSVTFMSCLRLCSCLRDLDLARQIHNRMVRVGFDCCDESSGGLINMYGKCGNALYAQRVFDNTHDRGDRNIVLSTSIMDAYFQDKSFEEALNLFANTESPNEYTFAISLNSIAELSLLKHGDLVHGLALKSGFRSHVMVGNALVNMYAKAGSIEDAREAFSEMGFKDVVTWNTMICGLSHHGLGKEALGSFEKMTIEAGEFPNRITFIGVLQACSHAGFVNQGLYCFNKLMKEHHVEPNLRHYTCVVGLLSRAGLFEEAEKLMNTSSHIEWDVVAWRTLLNACYVRRNYDLGKKVAESAMEMHPNDPGIYVLLSNIHAKSREWEGVAKVRSLMKRRRIKKEPGVSWISIRNRTHVFLAEENQHPEILLIYGKIKEILSKIKPLGYSPDVSEGGGGGGFRDVDEEQREDNLCYHSEKLAVAYGLMKTPENSALHVTKNLRICDDCHVAIKLISKLTNRFIVVRDSNRFHHFRDGECSCCDYW